MLHCMDGQGPHPVGQPAMGQRAGLCTGRGARAAFNELLTAESRQRLVQEIYPAYFQSGVCAGEEMTVRRRTAATVQGAVDDCLPGRQGADRTFGLPDAAM